MPKLNKTYFQDIHYLRKKPNCFLYLALGVAEFFYKIVINLKNYLYEKNILKETKTDCFVTCVGNLTTGGVGKTPITINLANSLSENEPVAIVSRGYGAKLNNKNVNVIKDFDSIKFTDGSLCGDEPYQIAKKINKNVVLVTSKNRVKAVNFVKEKYNIKTVILDDGFSNRTIKKDKSIIVIDSKMRFGSEKLLPLGPLREPVNQIKRAQEIILVSKGDKNLDGAITWVKQFNKKIKICKMEPSKIYNISSHAEIKVTEKPPVIAFCAIGQPEQFFDFTKEFYDVKETVSFSDHYKYRKQDIKNLIETAKKNKTNTLITTQKDEAKLKNLISDFSNFNFYVLELQNKFMDVN